MFQDLTVPLQLKYTDSCIAARTNGIRYEKVWINMSEAINLQMKFTTGNKIIYLVALILFWFYLISYCRLNHTEDMLSSVQRLLIRICPLFRTFSSREISMQAPMFKRCKIIHAYPKAMTAVLFYFRGSITIDESSVGQILVSMIYSNISVRCLMLN